MPGASAEERERRVVEAYGRFAGRPLAVATEVYESELPRVRTGQSAVVTLPYLPGEELRGRVSLILPALNPESRARPEIGADIPDDLTELLAAG